MQEVGGPVSATSPLRPACISGSPSSPSSLSSSVIYSSDSSSLSEMCTVTWGGEKRLIISNLTNLRVLWVDPFEEEAKANVISISSKLPVEAATVKMCRHPHLKQTHFGKVIFFRSNKNPPSLSLHVRFSALPPPLPSCDK